MSSIIKYHRPPSSLRVTKVFTTLAPVLLSLQFFLTLVPGTRVLSTNIVGQPATNLNRATSVNSNIINNKYATCGVCEPSKCPALHYCEGKAVKDHCQCCMICSDDNFQPHLSHTTQRKTGFACSEVKCPNLKFCVENVQGLPLCECPGEHMCSRSRKREICGTDGMTYSSRCHMRIASCNNGVHIKKSYRGQCKPEDTPATAAEYRRRLRRLKRRRMKRRRLRKQGKAGNKQRAQRRKEKREKRRRKRRKIGGRKKRMRRHRKLNEDRLAAMEKNFGLATWN